MSTIAPPSLKSSEKTYKSKSKSQNKDKHKHKKSKEKNTKYKTALSSVFVASDSDPDVPTTTENATDSTSLAPPGYVRVVDVVDAEEFDYDALKDNGDLELWVVRVPNGIKPKHLSNTSFSLPPPRSVSSLRLGTLERKNASYDFWSLPPTPHSKQQQSARDEQGVEDNDMTAQSTSQAESAVGGDELLGLTCLFPRKKKDGKLFVAPKPITHHIVLSAQPALPTPPTSSPDSNHPRTSIYKNPARYHHPAHLLKHRFVPTGAPPKHSSGQESMVIDAQTQPSQTQTQREEKDAEAESPSQKKKRKINGEAATKKARKAKTAS